MSVPDVLAELAQASLSLTLVLPLVLLLRRPLRRAFGAAVAYAVWWVVPAVLLAVCMPVTDGSLIPSLSALREGADATLDAELHLPAFGAGAVLGVWLAGGAMVLVRELQRQRRFTNLLADAVPLGPGEARAGRAVPGLPAVIGLWRPRIVFPHDFEIVYTPEQRELIRGHERVHIRRGDLFGNAAMLLVRSVFWFHPLVHFAAARFIHDQELACDQRVLALHPHSRRAYADAMLKTQLAAQGVPLGGHWSNTHPLKERIEMIKRSVPSKRRHIVGAGIVALLTAGAGFAAWAAQPGALDRNLVAESRSEGRYVPPPKYPAEAVAKGVGGQVMLIVDFDEQGRPTRVEVESSQPSGVFEASTVQAAWQWRFTPETKNGRPVPGRVRVPVTYEPRSSAAANS